MEDRDPPQATRESPTIPIKSSEGNFSALHARPTVADLNGENQYAKFARQHWNNATKPPTVKAATLKAGLWDELEREKFAYGSLLLLENLQVVEQYLWPGLSDDASDYHVLLLAILINVKRREGLPVWTIFQDKPDEFSAFFRRVLSLTLDRALSLLVRNLLINFIIGAFQSLDNALVRRECVPLVSISIWSNLHSSQGRETRLEPNPSLKRSWRGACKRYDNADDETRTRLEFERSWLYTLILEFLDRMYEQDSGLQEDSSLFCERLLELLTDLLSQLPTRRYVRTLLQDLNVTAATKLSPLYSDEDQSLLRELFLLYEHYANFPVDDQTGHQSTQAESQQTHFTALSKLQRVAHKHFREKLSLLALSNYGSLASRSDLASHLELLDVHEMQQLCHLLGLRTQYLPNSCIILDRAFFIELIVSTHERPVSFRDSVRQLAVLPTETSLYEKAFLRNEAYNGSRPLAIPKLNLQYLTVSDFLWRAFTLYRCESFYGIRTHIEDTIKRVKPRSAGAETRFDGFSRMALPISKVAIQDVAPANVGEDHPSQVRAEVILEVNRLNFTVRQEWESLKPGDMVYLAAVHEPDAGNHIAPKSLNGRGEETKVGLAHLRLAEVIQVQDEHGKPLRDRNGNESNGFSRRPQQRRLILSLDATSYAKDVELSTLGKPNVYENINLLIRRRGRENNFRPVLDSIKRLTLSDVPAPSWLQDVFLGYGDPAGATYKRLPNRLKSIDFRDTFLDWQHLIESLPGRAIEPNEDMEGSFPPPYVLETIDTTTSQHMPRPTKKRRRDAETPVAQSTEVVKVSTYKAPNTGPYPTDAPRHNAVRFTPAQIEAINSGTQPGLTVIVGPPGTGKTDVATQIINNIYHDFPTQRTLLIAHSNQALNQLFQKIVALDIDERHLLRLGHGEEDLETSASYSKHGRVESFIERGATYLAEVDRLAASMGVDGAHGSTCETADYFNLVYVKPTWKRFLEIFNSNHYDQQQKLEAFPFYNFFSTAPQPLFPDNADFDDIVSGCYRHIEKLFSELEDIRPFEILRNSRDRANYLLIKEARIVAMTSTHAAMRRQEIADLGFRYDNIIMEEAAQVTEIENFIPLALQKPKEGEIPLQRVVLCGDHLQNSPIIGDFALRQYANLEQSLFLRLIRLGVPTMMLDKQGRARPSLAELYRWRYPKLGDLPIVETLPEFRAANAGLQYDFQFIDVPDYKGRGEMEPTAHFIQNLGEAEYVVALYMYMRLLGYPASKISILTTYAGQKALIRDVLGHRCKGNRLFGLPRIVATVDKYQGEQNDYILLSLVRTSRVGYLRDIRRLTVALSRARLGLYIFGRREVFEVCYELKEAFEKLFARSTKLSLVTGEMHPTTRLLEQPAAKDSIAEMDGLEHLGQYVFQMTQKKIAALKSGMDSLPVVDESEMVDVDADDDGEGLLDDGETEEAGPELDEADFV